MLLKGSLRVPGTLDGGLSWFAVLGSFMTQFVVMGIHNVFGLLYLDLLTEFGESKATTGKKATPNLPSRVSNRIFAFTRFFSSQDVRERFFNFPKNGCKRDHASTDYV